MAQHTAAFLQMVAGTETVTNNYYVNMAAADHFSLFAFSAVGPCVAIKALHAALKAKAPDLSIKIPHFKQGSFTLPTGKTRLGVTHLSLDAWQLMYYSESDRFLFDTSEQTLWDLLRSEKFTTPVLRSWMKPLRRELMKNKQIKPCEHLLNCSAATTQIEDGTLDALVSQGIKAGVLELV